jgi:hypothetical protein
MNPETDQKQLLEQLRIERKGDDAPPSRRTLLPGPAAGARQEAKRRRPPG